MNRNYHGSTMDHSMPGMDHGEHGGGGMDMGGKCAMHMLWNTQIIDTCIVFPQWHIRSYYSFALSFFAIVALGIAYEWLRSVVRRVDQRVARRLAQEADGSKVSGRRTNRMAASNPGSDIEEDTMLLARSRSPSRPSLLNVPRSMRILRASLYAAQVFLSFFLMLIFMTYNAYLIFAVVLGAAIGHFYLGGQLNIDSILHGAGDKGMACH